MTKRFCLQSKTIFLYFVLFSFFFLNEIKADSTSTAVIDTIYCFSKNHPYSAGLENEIFIGVKNAPQLNDEKLQTSEVILFFDGIPLKDVNPRKNSVDKNGNGELVFFIPHEEEPAQVWSKLLRTSQSGELFQRKVCINAGLYNETTNQLSLVTEEYPFTLILVQRRWFWIAVILLTLLLITLILLAIKSDILRDTGCNPPAGQRRPFSLARTQMAVWTFVIISGWLLLYVCQHRLNSITDSMAVLMGISSVTGLGSVALDQKKGIKLASRGFFRDILSDASGISFHRFQIFAWTLVMVIVFCRQVIFYFEMPEFESSLLVLMGISSGTYIGYKVTENPQKQVTDSETETSPPAG